GADARRQRDVASALSSESAVQARFVNVNDRDFGPADQLDVVVYTGEVAREASVVRELRDGYHDVPLVVVTPRPSGAAVRHAIHPGADAIVCETTMATALPISVRAAVAGQCVVPRELREFVTRPTFTHREKQVLRLVAEGYSNGQIGQRLFLA